MTSIDDVKRIQALAYNAYLETGKLMAALDGGDRSPMKLARSLEATAALFEKSTLELRQLCEINMPTVIPGFNKEEPSARAVTGSAEVNEYGWLHIKLNTLLPHCRFHAASWLTDTISRLLDTYESRGRTLPRFKSAMLVIDEHCDMKSRTIYDQDNKGWKAIPNALKGRVLEDDDQFSLGIALISAVSQTPACHIYLMPRADVGDFFGIKDGVGMMYL